MPPANGIAGGEVGVGPASAVGRDPGDGDLDVGVAGDPGRGEAGQALGVLDHHPRQRHAVEAHHRARREVGAEAGQRHEGAAGHRAAGGIEGDGVVGEGGGALDATAGAADLEGRRAGLARWGQDLEPPRVDEALADDQAAADPHLVGLAEALAADHRQGGAAEGAVVGVGVLHQEPGAGGVAGAGVAGGDRVIGRAGIGGLIARRSGARGRQRREHEQPERARHRVSMAQPVGGARVAVYPGRDEVRRPVGRGPGRLPRAGRASLRR
jgi:hypothetical protein